MEKCEEHKISEKSPQQPIDGYNYVCKDGILKKMNEICHEECPHSNINSEITVSVSKGTEFCKGLEENGECYKNFPDTKGVDNHGVNAVCLDPNTSIGSNCGFSDEYIEKYLKNKTDYIRNPGNYITSEVCPKGGESKIEFQQCFASYIVTSDEISFETPLRLFLFLLKKRATFLYF